MRSSILLSLLLLTYQKSFSQGIAISQEHPQFWEYNGKTLLLLGGSVEDNLFQIEDLEEHLDLLKMAGGNYVRCTMSSRDKGNVWPFEKQEDGLYDLEQWNKEYWNRFESFLAQTSARDIIVQIEVWATFDFYRDHWNVNPFNPKNNKNYDTQRSKLPTEVPTHPVYAENNFFRSVPSQMSLFKVLEYQQKYVDKLLEHTLKYDHVLYCMDNETSVTSEWGKFWSEYIKQVAQETAAKTVHTTEMWDPWDLSHVAHRETFDHPEIYSFVDISQNNHNKGQVHWNNGYQQILRIQNSGLVRPVNNIKVYGANGNKFGHDNQDGIERFVRNVFLGAASIRFHRPDSGLGLNDTAQAIIKSMRMFTDAYDHCNAEPMMGLLNDREENEAYCRAVRGEAYAIYFTNGGEVKLDLTDLQGNAEVKWLDILKSEWMQPSNVKDKGVIMLKAPSEGNWIALIH